MLHIKLEGKKGNTFQNHFAADKIVINNGSSRLIITDEANGIKIEKADNAKGQLQLFPLADNKIIVK